MISQQLTERFRTVLEDEPPVGFDPDQLVDDQRRAGRRRAAAVGSVVSAGAAVVAVVAVGLVGGGREEPTPPAADPDGRSAGPTVEFVSFESRIGGTQEVTPDPGVYEVTGKGSPPLHSEQLDIDSFLVDSYPGDRGVLQIRRGSDVLFQVTLGDHDAYAMQLEQPWSFTPEAPLRVAVSCHQAGAPGGTCEAGVTFTGFMMTP